MKSGPLLVQCDKLNASTIEMPCVSIQCFTLNRLCNLYNSDIKLLPCSSHFDIAPPPP